MKKFTILFILALSVTLVLIFGSCSAPVYATIYQENDKFVAYDHLNSVQITEGYSYRATAKECKRLNYKIQK
jgi:hypothetical protein